MGRNDPDRMAELKAFDDTKAGVKGLVDSGINKVPRIFIVPPEERVPLQNFTNGNLHIPRIDISSKGAGAQVKEACEQWGIFQAVGHGIPTETLQGALAAVKEFHEWDNTAGKAAMYSREPGCAAKYHSNFDLFQGKVANWRDTLYCRMVPDPPTADELPHPCREVLLEYSKQVVRLGETLFELLSQALGLSPNHLRDMECNKGLIVVSHYYPPCPQPELAIGTSRHSDSGFLTVLLQDQLGGLQVLHQDHWVDVQPIPGALVVNLGDLLQLISNDRFKSVEHRVVANKDGPRVSMASFFSTHFNSASTRMYGPIPELLSEENPPLYKETLVREYIAHYYSKGLDAKSALSDFRL